PFGSSGRAEIGPTIAAGERADAIEEAEMEPPDERRDQQVAGSSALAAPVRDGLLLAGALPNVATVVHDAVLASSTSTETNTVNARKCQKSCTMRRSPSWIASSRPRRLATAQNSSITKPIARWITHQSTKVAAIAAPALAVGAMPAPRTHAASASTQAMDNSAALSDARRARPGRSRPPSRLAVATSDQAAAPSSSAVTSSTVDGAGVPASGYGMETVQK